MRVKRWEGEGFEVRGRADGTVRLVLLVTMGPRQQPHELEFEFELGPARDLADAIHAAAAWAKENQRHDA